MRPTPDAVTLARLAYGHTAEELERLKKVGQKPWLEEQLAPPAGDDPATAEKLKTATLHIEYGPGKDGGKEWKGVKEDRPLQTLTQTAKELWPRRNWQQGMDYQERIRPREEVVSASWVRARYAKFQVREVLTAFWHDHFHVNAHHDDVTIAVTWPLYDAMLRRNALGNFRKMLEEVATSIPMLVYLNNRTSRASPANENFARELFELHTLGKDAYLNDLYNRWREVPGATRGRPSGYIDQDVYEAARAFTGWTIADGGWGVDSPLPNTGEFLYFAGFHDPYQKRVLGVELDANAPPMSDGRKVLDLVADHPATARHIAKKLVKRLVADDPPASLVDRAAKAFRDHAKAEDQIARVVRVIAESDEFERTWGKKTKKPFEFMVSLARATGADVKPDPGIQWLCLVMGQRLYGWPTPDGAPDEAGPWLSANSMLGRWNVSLWLNSKQSNATKNDFLRETPESIKTLGEAAEYWLNRLLVGSQSADTIAALREAITQWAPAETPLVRPQAEEALIGVAALAAMAPEFQLK